MKNKQKRISRLIWKYFWEQKINEVGWTILILFAIFCVPAITGFIVGEIGGEHFLLFIKGWGITLPLNCLSAWLIGISYLLVFSVFIGIGYFIFELIKTWLERNWEEATERAISDFEEGKKNG